MIMGSSRYFVLSFKFISHLFSYRTIEYLLLASRYIHRDNDISTLTKLSNECSVYLKHSRFRYLCVFKCSHKVRLGLSSGDGTYFLPILLIDLYLKFILLYESILRNLSEQFEIQPISEFGFYYFFGQFVRFSNDLELDAFLEKLWIILFFGWVIHENIIKGLLENYKIKINEYIQRLVQLLNSCVSGQIKYSGNPQRGPRREMN